MDAQYLDGYITNLVYEIEVNRGRLGGCREDADGGIPPPRDQRLLPWLGGFAGVWLGVVALGLFL